MADGFGGEGICYAMASGDLAATVASRALSEEDVRLGVKGVRGTTLA